MNEPKINEPKMYALPEPLRILGCVVDQLETASYFLNGQLAVELGSQMEDDPEVHEPFATLSVNLADQADILDEGEFFIKEYSENEETAKAMLDAGYIEIVEGKTGTAGYVGTVRVAKLTPKALSKPLEG